MNDLTNHLTDREPHRHKSYTQYNEETSQEQY